MNIKLNRLAGFVMAAAMLAGAALPASAHPHRHHHYPPVHSSHGWVRPIPVIVPGYSWAGHCHWIPEHFVRWGYHVFFVPGHCRR